MVKIYINTILPTEELTEESFTEAFDIYASKLEKLTKVFKGFSKFVKKHGIQVKNVDGFANSGTFEVDEIDAARLKKAGYVVDYAELEAEPEIPAFYIDKNLDAVLAETKEKLETLSAEQWFGDQPAQLSLEFPQVPNTEEVETMTFNLSEVLDSDVQLEGNLVPGHMVLQVFPQEEDSHKYNLMMLDFYSDPAEFKIDREKMLFSYREKDEEEWKEKPLADVLGSLKTANALISNIVIMVRENPYLFETLTSLDQDLRFLQQLIVFDYALEDNTDLGEGLEPDFEV